MSAPPLTQIEASAEEADDIRQRVRAADPLSLGPNRVIAGPEHATSLTAMLSDPRVSDPIYDLPRPLTETNVREWIAQTSDLQARGEAVMILTLDESGEVAGYSRFSVWPDRSSAEIAGATRADLQNRGQGTSGASRSFDWMFETLGVRLIGLTAATDNVRSARVIEAAGFRAMGQRQSLRPDGTRRDSFYWEMSREDWISRNETGRQTPSDSPPR